MTGLDVCFEYCQDQLMFRIRRRERPGAKARTGHIISPTRLYKFLVIFMLAAVSTKAATVSGTVFDRAGAVVRGSRVIFHWDASGSNQLKDITGGGRQDVSMVTDEDGQFSVELKPGFYDVFVAAMAFSPHCEKVRVKDKEMKMSVTLDVSPIVIKETGDSVVVD